MAAHKKTQTDALQIDEARVQQLLARRQAFAEELHGCTSRVEAHSVLADVFTADEATQMGLLKALVRMRDGDSADLLLAAYELAPIKAVRKEARRGLIQLADAKIYPSWTPEPEPAAVGSLAVENTPRFWQGIVSEARESGEIQLLLCWEYGFEYGEARVCSFLLDFWHDGVKDFFTDTGTRRYIEGRLKDLQMRTLTAEPEEEGRERTTYTDCTLAEGRRLLNDALDVNRWRKTTPHKDFRQALLLVQRLVLHADEVGEDRGLTFIDRNTDPDMVAANFVGAWSLGDYGLCYDLLTRSSSLLSGHSREEWMSLRRAWADEALPNHLEVYFLNEREPASQTGIWLPASVLALRAAGPKEVEIGWSLELSETQLSGTLPEMPMGTAVYKETGRRWFWTVFFLEQEQGAWRVARIQDEGAAVQALPLAELEKRVQEHDEVVQKIIREHRPDAPENAQHFEELVRRNWQLLALDDALLVRNPLDKSLYERAYGRAMSLRAFERTAVYAEELVRRFPNDPDSLQAQQRLATVQLGLSDRLASLGRDEKAAHFAELSEAVLRGTLPARDTLSYLILAELLTGQDREEEAEPLLLEARTFTQVRDAQAQIEFALALIAVNQQRFAEAQSYLERLAEIKPTYPALWTMLGSVHRELGNFVEAEVALKRSMDDDPTEERAYIELGAVYIDRDELDQARDVLARGIRVLPQSAHLLALMALIYIKKNDLRRAREYVQAAERLDPDLEITQIIRDLLKDS
jgi:tetratricopeptide (TPR) repeat protein